jgi:hypothetical protein
MRECVAHVFVLIATRWPEREAQNSLTALNLTLESLGLNGMAGVLVLEVDTGFAFAETSDHRAEPFECYG